MYTLCLHSDGRLLNHQQQSLIAKFIFAPKNPKRSLKRNEFSIAVGLLLAGSCHLAQARPAQGLTSATDCRASRMACQSAPKRARIVRSRMRFFGLVLWVVPAEGYLRVTLLLRRRVKPLLRLAASRGKPLGIWRLSAVARARIEPPAPGRGRVRTIAGLLSSESTRRT